MSTHDLTPEQIATRDDLITTHYADALKVGRRYIVKTGRRLEDVESVSLLALTEAATAYVAAQDGRPFGSWLYVTIRRHIEDEQDTLVTAPRWARRRISLLIAAGHHPETITTVDRLQAAAAAAGMSCQSAARSVLAYAAQRLTITDDLHLGGEAVEGYRLNPVNPCAVGGYEALAAMLDSASGPNATYEIRYLKDVQRASPEQRAHAVTVLREALGNPPARRSSNTSRPVQPGNTPADRLRSALAARGSVSDAA